MPGIRWDACYYHYNSTVNLRKKKIVNKNRENEDLKFSLFKANIMFIYLEIPIPV